MNKKIIWLVVGIGLLTVTTATFILINQMDSLKGEPLSEMEQLEKRFNELDEELVAHLDKVHLILYDFDSKHYTSADNKQVASDKKEVLRTLEKEKKEIEKTMESIYQTFEEAQAHTDEKMENLQITPQETTADSNERSEMVAFLMEMETKMEQMEEQQAIVNEMIQDFKNGSQK